MKPHYTVEYSVTVYPYFEENMFEITEEPEIEYLHIGLKQSKTEVK